MMSHRKFENLGGIIYHHLEKINIFQFWQIGGNVTKFFIEIIQHYEINCILDFHEIIVPLYPDDIRM